MEVQQIQNIPQNTENNNNLPDSNNNNNIKTSVQFQPNQCHFSLGFKLLFLLQIGIIMVLFRLFFLPSINVQCLVDRAHQFLGAFNKLVNQDHQIGNSIIIATSLIIDFFTISSTLYWLVKGKSLRIGVVVAIFYIFRIPHLWVFTPKFPEGFYWKYPGFPSLTVPYDRTSDFFFSGHCGILTITMMEWRALKEPKLFYLNFLGLCFTATSLLILRVHYFIDISMGIVVAHWIHQNVLLHEEHLNKKALALQNWLGIKAKAYESEDIEKQPNHQELQEEKQ